MVLDRPDDATDTDRHGDEHTGRDPGTTDTVAEPATDRAERRADQCPEEGVVQTVQLRELGLRQ